MIFKTCKDCYWYFNDAEGIGRCKINPKPDKKGYITSSKVTCEKCSKIIRGDR